MDRDDGQFGRILTRREALALIGSTAVLALTGCSLVSSDERRRTAASPVAQSAGSPMCVVRHAQPEGPCFVDERLDRSDIRTDPSDGSIKPGAPLLLTFNVSRIAAGACVPLAGGAR